MNLKPLFQRYMKQKDPAKAHAVLSASGAERWMNCPASIRLSKGIIDKENEWSVRGTHTHTLMQFILENEGALSLLNHPSAKAFKEFIGYSEEQLQSAGVAVSYVSAEQMRMVDQYGQWPTLLVEEKVKLEGVGFGTADVILYQPFGVLHVIDYKNGVSVVEPEENYQGLYYAHAAADRFGWDFSEVWITIVQPNAVHKRGPIRTWKTTPKRLEKMGNQFLKGAARTQDENAPLAVGKWCWFCPARPICPKQMKIKNVNIMNRFKKGVNKNGKEKESSRKKEKSFCEEF